MPYTFSKEERAALQEQFVDDSIRLDQLQEEKKAKAAEYSALIKTTKSELRELRDRIRAGREEREVDAEKDFDFANRMVNYYAPGTGELLHTRPMRPEERQLEIPSSEGVVPIRKQA